MYQRGPRRDGENWADCRFISETDQTGFSKGLDVGYRRNVESRNDSDDVDLSNWRRRGVLYREGQGGRLSFGEGGEIRSSVWGL